MDRPGIPPTRDDDTFQSISAEDVMRMLRGRPGLIVGPTLSMGAGCLNELAKKIAKANDCSEYEYGLFPQIDKLIEIGVDPSTLREQLREAFRETGNTSSILSIGRTRWSAVLSASWDTVFEQELQDWCDSSPTRPPVRAGPGLDHKGQ